MGAEPFKQPHHGRITPCCLNSFHTLEESGKWTKSKPVANKPEEEASDQKFLALVAAVKELAKAKDGNEQRTGGKGGNDKWKYEEPKDTKTIKKEVAGKTYWWCTGKNGENHKKMWCRHEPNTCNGTRPEKKGTPTAAAPYDESKPVARLKANKAITAALAALDEALKPKADTGYASDDSDFQCGVRTWLIRIPIYLNHLTRINESYIAKDAQQDL